MKRLLKAVAVAVSAAATAAVFMGCSDGLMPPAGTVPNAPQDVRDDRSPSKPPLGGLRVALLGDSFAGGEGGGRYLTGTDEPGQRCHRSSVGLLSGSGAVITNLACSRATTHNLTRPQQDADFNVRAEPRQLSLVPEFTDIAVVMVGGNDIRFAEIFFQCVVSDADCAATPGFTARALNDAENLAPELANAYRKVAAAIGGGEVLVPAYPQMFSGHAAECGRMSAAEAAFARDLTAALNRSVRRGAEAAAADLLPVRYVESTEDALAGHGACDPEPYVHSVLPTALIRSARESAGGQELLHPTAAGYRRMTEATIDWLAVRGDLNRP